MMNYYTAEQTKALKLTEVPQERYNIKDAGYTIKDASEIHVNTHARDLYIGCRGQNAYDDVPDDLYDGFNGVFSAEDGKFYTVYLSFCGDEIEPLMWLEIIRE